MISLLCVPRLPAYPTCACTHQQISELRDKNTTPQRFRQLIHEITRFLGADASKWVAIIVLIVYFNVMLTLSRLSLACYHYHGWITRRNLSLAPVTGLETPLAPYTGWALGEKVGLAPILRAGIQMTDGELHCYLIYPRASLASSSLRSYCRDMNAASRSRSRMEGQDGFNCKKLRCGMEQIPCYCHFVTMVLSAGLSANVRQFRSHHRLYPAFTFSR